MQLDELVLQLDEADQGQHFGDEVERELREKARDKGHLPVDNNAIAKQVVQDGGADVAEKEDEALPLHCLPELAVLQFYPPRPRRNLAYDQHGADDLEDHERVVHLEQLALQLVVLYRERERVDEVHQQGEYIGCDDEGFPLLAEIQVYPPSMLYDYEIVDPGVLNEERAYQNIQRRISEQKDAEAYRNAHVFLFSVIVIALCLGGWHARLDPDDPQEAPDEKCHEKQGEGLLVEHVHQVHFAGPFCITAQYDHARHAYRQRYDAA